MSKITNYFLKGATPQKPSSKSPTQLTEQQHLTLFHTLFGTKIRKCPLTFQEYQQSQGILEKVLKISSYGSIYRFCCLQNPLMCQMETKTLKSITNAFLNVPTQVDQWLVENKTFRTLLKHSPWQLLILPSSDHLHSRLFQQQPFRTLLKPIELWKCWKCFRIQPSNSALIQCSLWFTISADDAFWNQQSWTNSGPFISNIPLFKKRAWAILHHNPMKRNQNGHSYPGFNVSKCLPLEKERGFQEWLRNEDIPFIQRTFQKKTYLVISEWNDMEQYILQRLQHYMSTVPNHYTAPNPDLITRFSPDQKVAFDLIQKCNMVAISGAGGTGKSELPCALSQMLTEGSMSFLTPSGKAAENLNKRFQQNGLPLKAETYHRKLVSSYHSKQHIKHLGTVLVLDEASMINLWDLYFILQLAEKEHVKQLIFLGDPKQLPPVSNNGTLFHSLFRSDRFSAITTQLTTNFRSQAYQDLFQLGEEIRQVMDGKRKLTAELFQNKPNVHFHVFSDRKVLPNLIHQCLDHIQHLENSDFRLHTRIITMRRKFMFLYKSKSNLLDPQVELILKRFNPLRSNPNLFVQGDLCMSTQNIVISQSLVVSNGSEGIVKKALYQPHRKTRWLSDIQVTFGTLNDIQIEPDHMVYNMSDSHSFDYTRTNGVGYNNQHVGLEDKLNLDKVEQMLKYLDHGEFTTTHKFQGSEQSHIIAIGAGIGDRGYSLELLYTQLSRARKSVYILLNQKILNILSNNPSVPFYNDFFQSQLESYTK